MVFEDDYNFHIQYKNKARDAKLVAKSRASTERLSVTMDYCAPKLRPLQCTTNKNFKYTILQFTSSTEEMCRCTYGMKPMGVCNEFTSCIINSFSL